MKITIDLEDFFLEEGDQLQDALKKHITWQVTQDITKSIKEKVDNEVAAAIRKQVVDGLNEQINSFISENIKTNLVKSYKDSSKLVPLQEYIAELFTYQSGWGTKSEEIKKLATQLGQEMKNRYDLLFASQLVAKMSETGLLKEDVAKILLTTK